MQYNFDELHDRRNTESVKWKRYDTDVLPLWVADTDFISPQPVLDALQARVAHGIFGYPQHTHALTAAIQDWLLRLYDWKVDEKEIIFMPCVLSGVHLAVMALTQPGDGLLVQPPVYPPINVAAKTTGLFHQEAEMIRQPDGSYSIDYEAFEKAITPQTSAFILCNPHNPTGRVFRRNELERMAEICLENDVWIISDEIHSDLVYPGHSHTPIAALSPEIARRTVTMMAPSKTFNIAGLGFAFAVVQDPDLRKRLLNAQHGLVPHANLLGQVAAEAAYTHGEEWLEQVMAYTQENRDFLYNYVRERLPGIEMGLPEGTYLAWLDCRESGIEGNPAQFFLEKARVALNDGEDFGTGGEGFVRLNFGCPRQTLEEALERMRSALETEVLEKQAEE